MRYLLDTCVISEALKAKPNKNVISWMRSVSEDELFISVLTFGEIEKGIEKAMDLKKKRRLQLWVEQDLKERFKNRIFDIDMVVATKWGIIQGKSEREGRSMPAIDGLIAITGLVNDCIIATRNVSDMQQSTAELFNPWEEIG